MDVKAPRQTVEHQRMTTVRHQNNAKDPSLVLRNTENKHLHRIHCVKKFSHLPPIHRHSFRSGYFFLLLLMHHIS